MGSHPASGGYKYRGLVLRDGGWAWGLLTLPCKKIVEKPPRNSRKKERKKEINLIRVRLARHVAGMRAARNTCKILVGKLQGKKLLGRLRH
jgi:hypothetical protein